MEVRDHEIYQLDGYRLAATSYAPDTPRAGIVFCHGWGGTKGILAPEISNGFVDRGDFVVVTFDFSGFGASEGPRNRLDPVRQQRDCRSVLTFLLSEWPSVHRRVGIFGLSFGGGLAVTVAGADRRVRALVSVGGFADGEQWLQDLRPYWQFMQLQHEIDEDAATMVRTGQSRVVDPEWIFPRDPAAADFNRQLLEQYPERKFTLDVVTAGLIADLKPIRAARDLDHCPSRFVHGELDVTAPASHAAQLAEVSGGDLALIEGVGHYDMYGPGNFERMIDLSAAWFGEHLLGP